MFPRQAVEVFRRHIGLSLVLSCYWAKAMISKNSLSCYFSFIINSVNHTLKAHCWSESDQICTSYQIR